MTLQTGDKLMSLTDVSEMLGIPLHTLYRWRYKGDGPVGYRVGRRDGMGLRDVVARLDRPCSRPNGAVPRPSTGGGRRSILGGGPLAKRFQHSRGPSACDLPPVVRIHRDRGVSMTELIRCRS
jgi:hypothetical protein